MLQWNNGSRYPIAAPALPALLSNGNHDWPVVINSLDMSLPTLMKTFDFVIANGAVGIPISSIHIFIDFTGILPVAESTHRALCHLALTLSRSPAVS